MFTTITTKFPSKCRRCGADIPAGTKIRYGGRGRTYHFKDECPTDRVDGDTEQQRVHSATNGAAGRPAFDEDGDAFDMAVEDAMARSIGLDRERF